MKYIRDISLFFFTTSPIVVVVQITLFLLLFPKELITFTNIILVLIIGLCDYFSQEVYRYLMINKSFRTGNIQLIYKSLFFLASLLVYTYLFDSISFMHALWIMFFSYLMLFILAYYSFNKLLYNFKKSSYSIQNKVQLFRSLKNVAPFLVLIVFIKGIEFSDKFIVSKTLGLEETGIYSFLFAVASSIHIFIVSGFYIIYLPQLIKLYSSQKILFKKKLLAFTVLNVVSSISLVFLIPLFAPFIFELIDKQEFSDQLMLLYLLLLGFMLNNLSLVPHIYLYIIEDERCISIIMGVSFLFNLILNLTLIPKFGILGASYSFVLTYLAVFLLKLIRAKQKWGQVAV